MLVLHKRTLTARWFFALAAVLTVTVSLGETLTMKDRRVYDGRIIRRGDSGVVFEVHKYGSTMRTEFPVREIASIREGPLVESSPRIPEPDPSPASGSEAATVARNSAEQGGHSPLLAMAMTAAEDIRKKKDAIESMKSAVQKHPSTKGQ
jgi:hypothetical protein